MASDDKTANTSLSDYASSHVPCMKKDKAAMADPIQTHALPRDKINPFESTSKETMAF